MEDIEAKQSYDTLKTTQLKYYDTKDRLMYLMVQLKQEDDQINEGSDDFLMDLMDQPEQKDDQINEKDEDDQGLDEPDTRYDLVKKMFKATLENIDTISGMIRNNQVFCKIDEIIKLSKL